MKQKLLSLGLFLFSIISGQNVFAYDFEVDGIFYTVTSFNDLTVSVDGFSNSMSGIIEIPTTVTYANKLLSVTSIKSGRNNNNSIESVIIPSSVTSIGQYAFEKSNINNIEIPDNVTDIGRAVFRNCKNLYSIKISKNVATLNPSLFEGCSSLTKIDWHPACTYGKICGRVFYNCTSLKTIRIPQNINLNGADYSNNKYRVSVFYNCTSLDSLIIEDGMGTVDFVYNDGTISAGTYYGEFKGCKIKYVYLGRSFKYDDMDINGHNNKTPVLGYVEHFEIGDNVKSIPVWLPNRVDGYSQLKTLIIGSSITKVGDYSSFYNSGGDYYGTYGNQALEYIKIKRSTPPEALGFSNYNYINTILYVPKGTKAAYESAEIWKNFWNIQEISDEETSVCAIKQTNDVHIRNLNGTMEIENDTDHTLIIIYSVTGQIVGSGKTSGGHAFIETPLRSGDVAIVRIGNEITKYVLQ